MNDNSQQYLRRDQLDLVADRFRSFVVECWADGEQVPYCIIYLVREVA